MKISIGYEFIDGPWGGGNSFAIQLKNYLKENGLKITIFSPEIFLFIRCVPSIFSNNIKNPLP